MISRSERNDAKGIVEQREKLLQKVLSKADIGHQETAEKSVKLSLMTPKI